MILNIDDLTINSASPLLSDGLVARAEIAIQIAKELRMLTSTTILSVKETHEISRSQVAKAYSQQAKSSPLKQPQTTENTNFSLRGICVASDEALSRGRASSLVHTTQSDTLVKQATKMSCVSTSMAESSQKLITRTKNLAI